MHSPQHTSDTTRHRSFDQAREAAKVFFYQANRKAITISKHDAVWRKFGKFLSTQLISEINKASGESFLATFKDNSYKRDARLSIKFFIEFFETGTVTFHAGKKEPVHLDGSEIWLLAKDFIKQREVGDKIAINTLRHLRHDLQMFAEWCLEVRVTASSISLKAVHTFLVSRCNKPSVIGGAIYALRGFVKYLHLKNVITKNFSNRFPRFQFVRQPKVPSIYTEREIIELLQSLKAAKINGIRNYAIILLAVRLGLRASDIAQLQFKHIDWVKCTIQLPQKKTGRIVRLDLLSDVGNAIIDYLQQARPNSDSPYIFLKAKAPYDNFPNGNAVSRLADRTIRNSSFFSRKRKSGSHAFRHSLMNRFTINRVGRQVASKALGHSDADSTSDYIRYDVESLKSCVLEAVAMEETFYQNINNFYSTN